MTVLQEGVIISNPLKTAEEVVAILRSQVSTDGPRGDGA